MKDEFVDAETSDDMAEVIVSIIMVYMGFDEYAIRQAISAMSKEVN